MLFNTELNPGEKDGLGMYSRMNGQIKFFALETEFVVKI